MFWCVYTNRKNVYRWRFRRITCASASIRQGLWFQQINLNFIEVFILTYGIVHSYEHERENMSAFDGIPHYFQRYGLHLSLGLYIFAAGCQSDNVEWFIKVMGIVVTVDWIYTPPPQQGHGNKNCPSPFSALLSRQNAQRISLWHELVLVACASPRMTFQFIRCAERATNR